MLGIKAILTDLQRTNWESAPYWPQVLTANGPHDKITTEGFEQQHQVSRYKTRFHTNNKRVYEKQILSKVDSQIEISVF